MRPPPRRRRKNKRHTRNSKLTPSHNRGGRERKQRSANLTLLTFERINKLVVVLLLPLTHHSSPMLTSLTHFKTLSPKKTTRRPRTGVARKMASPRSTSQRSRLHFWPRIGFATKSFSAFSLCESKYHHTLRQHYHGL